MIVVFDEAFGVEKAVRVPRSVVNELFPYRIYVNGRVITLTSKLLTHPAVEVFSLSDALLDA